MTSNGLVFLDSTVQMPLLQLPVRTVSVDVSSGRVLISPGSKLSEDQLRSLGSVTDIVAPNLFHCAGVPKAAQVFPQAKIWAPAGASEQKDYLQSAVILTPETWPYQKELACFAIGGMPKVNEMVFIHRESRSLIVSDLAFNLLDVKGLGPWIILNLFGTYKRFGISRFYYKFASDKKAFGESIERLLQEDFDRIVVGHGTIVESGGRQLLAEAYRRIR